MKLFKCLDFISFSFFLFIKIPIQSVPTTVMDIFLQLNVHRKCYRKIYLKIYISKFYATNIKVIKGNTTLNNYDGCFKVNR